MTTAELISIVQSMANNRKYFYSEADFQHSLALALKANGYNCFLEYPVLVGKVCHIDIIVEKDGILYPIELKYKTKAMTCAGLCGNYQLRPHNAQDINRYLFWKDVDRLERLKSSYEGKISKGFVVFLTNDDSYWQSPVSSTCIDRLFRIHSGMIVQKVDWKDTVHEPDYVTQRSRYNHFLLKNSYLVPDWLPFSTVNDLKTGKPHYFKFHITSI